MNDQTQKELSPCPFCGARAGITKSRATGFAVTCSDGMCGARMELFGTRAAAIKGWNNRVNPGSPYPDPEVWSALQLAVKLMDVPERNQDEEWYRERDLVLKVWDTNLSKSREGQSVGRASLKGAAPLSPTPSPSSTPQAAGKERWHYEAFDGHHVCKRHPEGGWTVLFDCATAADAVHAVELHNAPSVQQEDTGPKTLDAKWLDPECWDGCQSLKFKAAQQEDTVRLEGKDLGLPGGTNAQ